MKLKGPLFSLTATGEFKGLSFSHNQHGANAHLKFPRENEGAFLKSEEHIFTLQVLRYIWFMIMSTAQRNSWKFFVPKLNSFISFLNVNYHAVFGDEKVLLTPSGPFYFEVIEPTDPYHLIQRIDSSRTKLYILDPIYPHNSKYNHYSRVKIEHIIYQCQPWEDPEPPNGSPILTEWIVNSWYYLFNAFISAGISRIIFLHYPLLNFDPGQYHTFKLLLRNFSDPDLEEVEVFWINGLDHGYVG